MFQMLKGWGTQVPVRNDTERARVVFPVVVWLKKQVGWLRIHLWILQMFFLFKLFADFVDFNSLFDANNILAWIFFITIVFS